MELHEDAEGCRGVLENTGEYVRALGSCKREGWVPKWNKARLWYLN